jgi:hypothetical protein
MRARAAVVAALAVALAACGGRHPTRLTPATPADELPDLVAAPPSHVTVGTLYAGGRYHSYLGFNTRVTNRGPGALDLVGRRRPGSAVMVADQLVHGRGAAPRVVRGVAWLRFERKGHGHWHLLPFASYELRSVGGGRVRVRGRKQGFCIDGFSVGLVSATPRMPSSCGEGRPHALSVHEQLGVGEADEYGRFLAGQSIYLDGVPTGRYDLVLAFNRTRRLRERDYSNDVATTVVRLGSTSGVATVRTLRTCRHAPPCG